MSADNRMFGQRKKIDDKSTQQHSQVRWLQSGVELKYSNEVATEGGGGFSAEIDMNIEIDSKHRATIKKIVRKQGSSKGGEVVSYGSRLTNQLRLIAMYATTFGGSPRSRSYSCLPFSSDESGLMSASWINFLCSACAGRAEASSPKNT